MTAATLGASAAVPASACTSDATTTVCCGVSPVAAALPRPTASPCSSNSDTIVCRIGAVVHALDEVGVGPGEPLDRRLVALVLRTDLRPTARARGTRRGRGPGARRRDRRSARAGGRAGARARCARRSRPRSPGGSPSASTAAFTPMCSRSVYVPACDDPPDTPVPDLEDERRADDVLARELVADLLRAPALLHGHAHRRAVAARFVELPDEPRARRARTAARAARAHRAPASAGDDVGVARRVGPRRARTAIGRPTLARPRARQRPGPEVVAERLVAVAPAMRRAARLRADDRPSATMPPRAGARR